MTIDILHFDQLEDVRGWLTGLPQDTTVGQPGRQDGCLVHAFAIFKLTGNPDPVAAFADAHIACFQDDYYIYPTDDTMKCFPLNQELARLSWSFDNIERRTDEDDAFEAVTVADALGLVNDLLDTREQWLEVHNPVEPD
jgi:hypothetical protein